MKRTILVAMSILAACGGGEPEPRSVARDPAQAQARATLEESLAETDQALSRIGEDTGMGYAEAFAQGMRSQLESSR